MLQREYRGKASLNHGRTGQARARPSRAGLRPAQLSFAQLQLPALPRGVRRLPASPAPRTARGEAPGAPASPLPPLWRPPAPSASLTGRQWRRRRATRMRAENRVGRSRTAAAERRYARFPSSSRCDRLLPASAARGTPREGSRAAERRVMDPCPAAGGARRHSAPRRPEEALQAGGAGALQTGCGEQSAGSGVHWGQVAGCMAGGQFAAMFSMHSMSTEGTAPTVPVRMPCLPLCSTPCCRSTQQRAPCWPARLQH